MQFSTKMWYIIIGDIMNFKDAKQYGFSQEELLSTKRDENGSLVLDDKIDLNELPIDAREGMGTEEREKFWFKTQDGKAYMFKSCVDGIDNYGIYSEIIAAEVAKKLNIPCANYELATINGQKGIITESIVKDDEDMITLEDFVGGVQSHPDEPANVDFKYTAKQLENRLDIGGYDKETKRAIMKDFYNRAAFDFIVGETDRHSENISFIYKKGDHKNIKMAPLYDTENAFCLGEESQMVKYYSIDSNMGIQAAKDVIPKMVVVPQKDASAERINLATLDELLMEEEYESESDALLFDAIDNVDMDEIFENLESKMNADLPFEVKKVAKQFISFKKKRAEQMLYGKIDIERDEEYIEKTERTIEANDKSTIDMNLIE